uniref:Uncharacterized protein n=1 Tax=Aegilops tauschii subsp. strangulata TaxID=200361 RepID=A0A453RBV5_AEGTS
MLGISMWTCRRSDLQLPSIADGTSEERASIGYQVLIPVLGNQQLSNLDGYTSVLKCELVQPHQQAHMWLRNLMAHYGLLLQ